MTIYDKRFGKAATTLGLLAFGLVGGTQLATGTSGSTPADQQMRAAGIPVSTAPMPTPPPNPSEVYRLDRGDRLRIRFFDRFDRDDLNGEYVLGERGQLRLPRIGTFYARDKSTSELERDIRDFVEQRGEKLGYFAIDIAECRPFYVAGLANKPGSYAFVPGMTVLHAVLLAGGIYRSANASGADAMRERSKLNENLERFKVLLARKSRLEAQQDEDATVAMPQELVAMEPLRAGKIVDLERNLLQRLRDVASREKAGLESFVALTQVEADSYQAAITAMTQRLQEQTSLFEQLKKLHEQKVINQQRFFEAVAALDAVQRDKQMAIAGLSHAKASLEKANKDLSMLSLANSARVAKELAEAEQEIARLRGAIEEGRRIVAGLEMLSGQGNAARSVAYRIMRRDRAGEFSFLQADETTTVMPGDVVQVEGRAEGDPVKSQ